MGPGKRPVPHQTSHVVPGGEAICLLPLMLSNAAGEVVGHADVEHPGSAGHDVGVVSPLGHGRCRLTLLP